MAVIGVVGASLVMWQQSAVFDARLTYVETQINKGDRFTAADGARQTQRIEALERWKEDHTRFGWEKTYEWNRTISELKQYCEDHCGTHR